MSKWTHPICEACWIEQESTYGVTSDGASEELLLVRRPTLVVWPTDESPPIEQCCFCGSPTIWGCYVRRDPQETSQFCHIKRLSLRVVEGDTSA